MPIRSRRLTCAGSCPRRRRPPDPSRGYRRRPLRCAPIALETSTTQRSRRGLMGAEPTTIDQRMVKSIAHPTRMRILTLLNQKTASPVELADELGEPLGNVSYHVRILLDLESIELVDTVPRRGALEHYYRALKRPWFKAADWQQLPASARRSVSDAVLAQVWKEVNEATKHGLFDARTDRHLSRTTLVLDDRGWQEVAELLN